MIAYAWIDIIAAIVHTNNKINMNHTRCGRIAEKINADTDEKFNVFNVNETCSWRIVSPIYNPEINFLDLLLHYQFNSIKK